MPMPTAFWRIWRRKKPERGSHACFNKNVLTEPQSSKFEGGNKNKFHKNYIINFREEKRNITVILSQREVTFLHPSRMTTLGVFIQRERE
jgi:hypothetical protein